MTSKRLKNLRTYAFKAQGGLCYYCDLLMWQSSPKELGLKAGNGAAYRCTAEHLIAKQDGGRDARENVVAAHARCNHLRHRRKGPARSPQDHRTLIQRRIKLGRWWPLLPAGMTKKPPPHPPTMRN